MRILITGSAGQLGQAMQGTLDGHSLVALDHTDLEIACLNDVRASLVTHDPDLVVNCAAYNQVDRAESEPEAAHRGNALGPRNLALVTHEHDIPLVHVSTDYVFDGTANSPYHEFSRPNPRSVYGASKLAGELEVRALNPHHYLVRTAWVYHVTGRNFPLTMLGLAGRPEVRVVSDQYGSPTYAPHLAWAIGELIQTAAYGTYHMAGQGGTSWFELTRMLYAELGIDTPVQPVPTAAFPRPAQRPPYSVFTTWQDPHILLPPWEEGLSELVTELARAPEDPERDK
jgi:dTDP-4-dehydrorhamnose reductase